MDSDLGFSFRRAKDGTVTLLREGRVITHLRGEAAAAFLTEAATGSEQHLQQLMARLTGNYKRGNERHASSHPRNRDGGIR